MSNSTGDGVINLRADAIDEDPEFQIDHKDDEPIDQQSNLSSTPVTRLEEAALRPHDKVRVKFDKFVHLIATHAYEEVFDRHADEDVIITTDLLADLANAHDDKKESKIPLVFVVGILLGIVITWIILRS
jgi:hypothetical protein